MTFLRSAVLLLAVAAAVSCSKTAASPSESPASAASPAAPASASHTLSLTYKSPTVGTEVVAKATGLPAGKTVDLTWGTVTGGWVIEDYYHFRGKKYSETTTSLGSFTVDCRRPARCALRHPGRLRRRARSDRAHRRQAGRAERHRGHAEVRDDPGIRARRHADRAQRHRARLADDGEHLGGELGQPGARVRVGGRHARIGGGPVPRGRTGRRSSVKVYTGLSGSGLFEPRAVARSRICRGPQFTFRDDAGPRPPSLGAYAEPYQRQPVPKTEVHVANAKLSLDSDAGPGRPRARSLRASGFARGASLQLVWQTSVGSRVSGNGFEPQENVIATAEGRRRRPDRVAAHDSRRPRRPARTRAAQRRQDGRARSTSSSKPASSACRRRRAPSARRSRST